MSLISLILLTFLAMASLASAAVLIRDEADALAYVDTTFTANDCRMSLLDFRTQMVADGVAPGEADMAQPTIGSEKIIRERRIMGAMMQLFQNGGMAEDATDPRIAISKFGGCA